MNTETMPARQPHQIVRDVDGLLHLAHRLLGEVEDHLADRDDPAERQATRARELLAETVATMRLMGTRSARWESKRLNNRTVGGRVR